MNEKGLPLYSYVSKQATNLIPDGIEIEGLSKVFDLAVENTIKCFTKTVLFHNEKTIDYLNSIQYPVFLYFLSRSLFMYGDVSGANKIFYLNKIVHGIDLFYKVDLGEHFLLSHSIGSVFCNTKYGDMSIYFQGCLVGVNNGQRPVLGSSLVMFTGSKIIGNCTIGNNVVVSAGTVIIDQTVPDNVIVFNGPNNELIFKSSKINYSEKYFIYD